jgi:thiol-disulfide isomerase/thioredoxin
VSPAALVIWAGVRYGARMARAHRYLLGLLTIAACSATMSTIDPPVPAAPVPAPVERADEPTDDRVAISGRLRAHDGSALRMAEVEIRRNGFEKPLLTAPVSADGTFSARVAPGAYMVSIAAVDHASLRRQTLVTGDLRVDGELGTYARAEPGPVLRVRAEFLDAKGATLGPGPTEAARIHESDPVYRVELSRKSRGAVRLRYQIASKSGGRTYNGPVADTYESDQGGDFWSVVDLVDRDVLDLDLRELAPPGREPNVVWTGESPTVAALLAFSERWSARIDEAQKKIPRKDGKLLEMTPEHRAEIAALSAAALAEVEATPDPALRDLLRAAHISAFTRVSDSSDEKARRDDLTFIVDHIAPDDIHLALLSSIDYRTVETMREADADLVARAEDWLERRARLNPDAAVALHALTILIDQADRRRDDARMAELYRLVKDPRFEGTYYRKFMEQQYDPERILQRGKPLPGFELAALDPKAPPVTSADRAGRLYLLEFWATWCGPCVVEMPKLHDVYAKINGARPGKGRGETGLRRLRPAKDPKVEFVFVSLDHEPAHVEAFRREHWAMPWTHAFVGTAGEKEIMKRFGFSGVPTAILVDETGTILETGEALRRDELLPTLERILAERESVTDRRPSGAPRRE